MSSGLSVQDLSKLEVSALTPLSSEVISRQATINVGTIGHVAHGKSTVVRGLSGVQTTKFKSEKERNITIKLGYANAKIYERSIPGSGAPGADQAAEDSDGPGRFTAHSSSHPDTYTDASGASWRVVRHISFVDCPGHDILMATMLNGAAVMDAALLLVAANEPCPQPQTAEHLAAIEIMGLKHIVILQNKVELVNEAQATIQQNEIRKFVAGSAAGDAPIIPISAILKYNLDVLAEYLCTQIPVPVRDFSSAPRMIIIRSFDVNRPGCEVDVLQGGVAGGSILRGVLKVGDVVEVRPGVAVKKDTGSSSSSAAGSGSRFTYRPLLTRISSLFAEKNALQYAIPGGLIGVGTTLDPALTKGDWLVGQLLGYPGGLPVVYENITVKYTLMRRLLGVKAEASGKVEKLKKGELLMVNVGSVQCGGSVLDLEREDGLCELELSKPVCVEKGGKIAISRRHDKHWRLIGYGVIVNGKEAEIDAQH